MCQEKKYTMKQRKITTTREAGNRRKEEFLHDTDYTVDCHILCEIRETISSLK